MVKDESSLSIPPEWREKFLIKRIDEEDIEISLEERNAILEALNEGNRFIQIGKYTLMLNSIKSIDPRYEPHNIPPRPTLKEEVRFIEGKAVVDGVSNQAEIDLWDALYKNKLVTQ